jgi:hypothetical protein
VVSERKELIELAVQIALGETQDCTFAALEGRIKRGL